jgi:hypothetical protein
MDYHIFDDCDLIRNTFRPFPNHLLKSMFQEGRHAFFVGYVGGPHVRIVAPRADAKDVQRLLDYAFVSRDRVTSTEERRDRQPGDEDDTWTQRTVAFHHPYMHVRVGAADPAEVDATCQVVVEYMHSRAQPIEPEFNCFQDTGGPRLLPLPLIEYR